MTSVQATRDLNGIFSVVARLTPAQKSLLRKIAMHSSPATVAALAEESGLHVSSVRETLDSLIAMNLVSSEKMPSTGRGRPAFGYIAETPADPAFPTRILGHMSEAVFTHLRETCDDPPQAARDIGGHLGDRALEMMGVPEHDPALINAPGFHLNDHMTKIRLFFTAFGLGATAHPMIDTGLVLQACPFSDTDPVDPLALEMRQGLVERVLERTAVGAVDVDYLVDGNNPLRCEVILTMRKQPAPEKTAVTIRYFGGAVEAAGCESERVAAADTLAEVLDTVSAGRAELGHILALSTFLVNQRPATPGHRLPLDAVVEVLPPFAAG